MGKYLLFKKMKTIVALIAICAFVLCDEPVDMTPCPNTTNKISFAGSSSNVPIHPGEDLVFSIRGVDIDAGEIDWDNVEYDYPAHLPSFIPHGDYFVDFTFNKGKDMVD